MTNTVNQLTVADVEQTYSGTDGLCCCGCAGNHTTREERSQSDLNRRRFDRVLRVVNQAILNGEEEREEGCYVSATVGNRRYICYLNQSR